MKYATCKRILSLALALVLLAGLLPTGVLSANAQTPEVTFRDVPNTYDASELMLDSAQAEEAEDTSLPLVTNEEGKVRVSIVLEKQSTLEKMDYTTTDLTKSATAATYRAGLKREQAAMEAKITQATGHAPEVVWNLTLAANVISAWVFPKEIDTIAALPGVKQVLPETKYDPAVVSETETVQPNMATSSPMIGADAAWAADYTGKGQRIAIIDSGLDTDHQSVDEGAFLYALDGDTAGLMVQEDVDAVLEQLNIYCGYPNSTGQIVGDQELTADALYTSAKIPFGYNYADRSLYLTHDNDEQSGHGSHVAGIAAGNRYIPDGNGGYVSALDTVFSQGVAPDAQILVMKVFGVSGGGYTSDMVAALEDALLLRCDSINMSMGSSVAGFTDASYYKGVFDRLESSDTVISISAGNNGAWAEQTGHGYLYTEDVNLQTAAEPGTHSTALTVASVDNDGTVGRTFCVGEQEIVYAEVQLYGRPALLSSLDTSTDGNGTELEYIHLNAYGNEYNYEGINVMGKVVLVSRGNGMLFKDIHAIAARKGAVAVIVYNNEPGPGMKMDVSNSGVDIPIVGISAKDAELIKNAGQEQWTDDGYAYYTGKLTVNKNIPESAIAFNSNYYTMSSFSSWGVPGTLSIKPEITAPGGNIYSINGETTETDQYITMSGTSMAAPQVAGMSAVLAQYLDETALTAKTDLSRRHLIQNLLMSTATPIIDKNTDLPYSLLQQGAGLVNLEDALNAESYITIGGRDDGKVKVELGDDPERKGVYTFDYTIHNFTDQTQNYVLDGAVYTQSYFEDNASFKNADAGKTWYMDYTMKQLGATVSFAVNGQTLQADGDSALPDLDGDNDADRADAQALLDLATGKLPALKANQDKADLNGDGRITAYDAELYLNGLSSSTLPVHGNSDVTVTVTITLADDDKTELETVYPNGAYIEAYITAAPMADAEGKVASAHSIPVLAFYGNWSDASMFDQMTYSQLLGGSYDKDSYFTGSNPYSKQMNFNYVTVKLNELAGETKLGGNPFIEDDTYNPDRNAISSGGRVVSLHWSLIRNAADFRAAIEDQDGKTYYLSVCSDEYGGGWSYAATYIPQNGAWYNVSDAQTLDEENGGWQPSADIADGTELTVKLQAAPEYYLNPADATHKNPWVDWNDVSGKNALTVPVAVDNTAPKLSVQTLDYSMWGEEKTVSVTVTDNRYTAAVLLMTPKGGTRLDAKAVNQENKGETVTLTFDVTDIWGSEFQIIAVDYAGNMTTKQAYFDNEYYGPTAKLLGPTTDTGNWPDMSSSAQWDSFDSNTNLDYTAIAAANTGAYAAAYGDGYLFYVGYMRKDGKLNYNLYVLDYPNMTEPQLVGESVSFNTIGAAPIRSMTYVPDDGGRLYFIKGGTLSMDGSYSNYQLRALDVATGQEVGMTYYFPEWGDMFKLIPTSVAYSPMEEAFYMVGYENGYNGKYVNLYKFELPTDSAEIWVEYVQELGIVYSDEAEEWDIDPDLELKANPDRTSVTVGISEYGQETVYIALRSSDPTRDYLYTYDGYDMTNTGLVRAHNAIVCPDAAGQNGISRDQAVELKLNAPATEVFCGGFLRLDVTLRPWCLENKSLIWSSSNEAVAAVDAEGRVTGISEGTATITVTTEAEPKLTQSVDITVKATDISVSFTGTGEDGISRMLTYDFGERSLTKGAALVDMDGNPITSAAADLGNYGSLWVQDQTEGEYRLHKIDPETGKSSFDSEPSNTGSKGKPILFNDISYDDGDSTTDDSEWIFATDGEGKIWCTQNREAPNTMRYVMEQEDAPTNFIGVTFAASFTEDETRFYPAYYLEISKNKLILNNFSYSDFFGWNSTYTYFTLSEQLEYLTDENGRYLDTLTYEPNSNSPILLHYNGSGYDVYWLSLDVSAMTATLLNLGTITGYTDVAGYTAEYYGGAASRNAAREALPAADENAAVPMETKPVQGSMNAVSESGSQTVDGQTYTTLTITAEEAAASGMLTVELDENLTLVSLTSPVELRSYNQEGDTITFGYASSVELAKGATLAVLRLTQTKDAAVAVTEVERGGEAVEVRENVSLPHTHSTTLTNAKEATCTEDGYTGDEVCTVCGETVRAGEVVSALGHDWGEWAVTKEATCTENGEEIHICKRDAEHTETREIEASGHKTERTNAKEATCTEGGYTGDEVCTVCGETIHAGEAVSALGHDWGEWTVTKEATCTENGEETHTCKRDAEHTETREIEASGHKTERTNAKEATCTEGGYTGDEVCTVCGETVNVGKAISALGHDWSAWTVRKAPTCTEKGEQAHECTRCREKETQELLPIRCPSEGYTDMGDKNAWYHDYIDTMITNGWMNGMENHLFRPEADLTRAQFVTILYRIAGEPSVEGKTVRFTDVETGTWYTDAVIWATDLGIVNGMSLTTFEPDTNITREQIAVILYRAVGAPKQEKDLTAGYPDADAVSAWAKDAMNWAIAEKLIGGSDGKLLPLDNASRAEAAAILLRMVAFANKT
ncbi:MAG: S8 family serine peptidase [Faecousia sp.]